MKDRKKRKLGEREEEKVRKREENMQMEKPATQYAKHGYEDSTK